MAVTKIHPIKTTLKKAIDYICNGDKTDDEIYVTTHLFSRENAHKEFELTKRQFNSRTKTLATIWSNLLYRKKSALHPYRLFVT